MSQSAAVQDTLPENRTSALLSLGRRARFTNAAVGLPGDNPAERGCRHEQRLASRDDDLAAATGGEEAA